MGHGFRAVFVNHTHPDEKHVSALRMMSFARALAAAGHKIILLCETLNPDDDAIAADDLKADLAQHDFATPYVLACRPTDRPLLARARIGRLPFGLRQVVLATSYLFKGGVFTDWRDGAEAYRSILAEQFRPDVVWATFGNTDAWNIARRISHAANCPWVADLKDPWGRFLPTGLANLVARRYGDAAHMTVFSDAHGAEAGHFFKMPKTTVYSGFDAVSDLPAAEAPLRVLLTGSVYDDDGLARLFDGLALWLRGASVGHVIFTYAGNDTERVVAQAHRLDGLCETDLRPYMPVRDLGDLQRQARINTYVHAPQTLFQHKVLELLAAGRPVVCVPNESAEATRIATDVGAQLRTAATPEDIALAFQQAADDTSTPDADKLNAYSWPRQADKLAALFLAVTGGRP